MRGERGGGRGGLEKGKEERERGGSERVVEEERHDIGEGGKRRSERGGKRRSERGRGGEREVRRVGEGERGMLERRVEEGREGSKGH